MLNRYKVESSEQTGVVLGTSTTGLMEILGREYEVNVVGWIIFLETTIWVLELEIILTPK